MDLGIHQRVALVFASSSGIGKGIAESLVKEGAKVCICSRDKDKLEKTKSEIGASLAIVKDLNKPGAVGELIDEVTQKLGAVEILVTNAGGPPRAGFESISTELWQEQFQSLWIGVTESIQKVLPSMKKNKWGRILLVTSIAAREPVTGLTISNGLRAGLSGLVKSISSELGPHGITVNALLPGMIQTDRLKEVSHLGDIVQKIPLRRLGKTEDIGALASFIVSAKAEYLTGQSILLDGGLSSSY